MNKNFSFFNVGEVKYKGFIDKNVKFVTKNQLLDKKTWDKCVMVFNTHEDSQDGGWRGEYWGKMMRGASLTYLYSKNKKLYKVLTYAVRELLKTQDELGRFSTYTVEKEFTSWDLWGRKYVLTGMQHFYRICKDKELKSQIVNALKRHADYIIDRIGKEEDKIAITETSDAWGNINSCTILEPIVELYKMTGEKRYFDFASYIISTGGCKDCNLIELANDDNIMPYQYPVTKAYEMMSFYEGVLAYYEITDEKKYLDVVLKFVDKIIKTDNTIVGSAGCTHELFDNSSVHQTEKTNKIMQETCVTVTWIRLLSRLIQYVDKVDYADKIEISSLNALYGAINYYNRRQYSLLDYKYTYGLTFDSYSPLVNGARGLGIGGYKTFSTGGYFGCCGCIGSAGTALFPLTSVMKGENEIVFNNYINGKIKFDLGEGNKARINIITNYPKNGFSMIFINLKEPKELKIKLRVPSWCKQAEITCGEQTENVSSGYYTIEKEFYRNVIVVDFKMELKENVINGKTAYTYGPLVLATDESKKENEVCKYELYRTTVIRDGKAYLLSDYASCGKLWNEDEKKVKWTWDIQNGTQVFVDENVPRINVWFD